MKTLDGFELKEGDACFVMIDANYEILPAIYLSEHAKDCGWDFEIPDLEDAEVGVIDVWKNKPNQEANND